jgi:F-type H+-transporting ATPase subunit a
MLMIDTFANLPVPFAASNPLDHVLDHPIIVRDGWFLLTNHMIMIGVAALLMLVVFLSVTRRYRSGELVPTGTRNFFEAIMMYIRNDVVKPILGNDTLRFIPFLWTLFFFILFMNLLGLLPLDAIQAWFVKYDAAGHPNFHPIYGTATANLGVTAALAIFSFILWNIAGIRANGIGTWAHHFLGGAPWYMAPVMVPVELLGMFVKPFALSIRLMANMTAGHVLVAVLISMAGAAFAAMGTAGGVTVGIPVVLGTTAIMMLELFVAFLQAYIFTFLTTLFIGQLVVHEHEHHEDEGGHHDEGHESIGGGDLTDFDKLPEAARHAGAHMAG